MLILAQPCRILHIPTTPFTILESICWAVADTLVVAEVYTDWTWRVILDNGGTESGYEDDHSQCQEDGKRDDKGILYEGFEWKVG